MVVNTYWYGIKVRLNHQETQSLLGLLGAAGATTFFTGVGVAPAVAAIIVAACLLAGAWIKVCDDGNGVTLHITWTAWLWVENPA